MSTGQAPIPKPMTLVVLMAFDRDDDGELRPAFEAREMPSAEQAVFAARNLAMRHAGVIAWSRVVKPSDGEFSEPTELYRYGEVPELE